MSKFIKGMDLSTLLELERCGAKYYEDGKEKDILDIMKEHDVDTIRIRLWNDPKSEDGDILIYSMQQTKVRTCITPYSLADGQPPQPAQPPLFSLSATL